MYVTVDYPFFTVSSLRFHIVVSYCSDMYEAELPLRRGSSSFLRQDIHTDEQEEETVGVDVEMQEEEETTISG